MCAGLGIGAVCYVCVNFMATMAMEAALHGRACGVCLCLVVIVFLSPFPFPRPLAVAVTISDFPRFEHRGLMLDSARHFLPVSVILHTIDAMVYSKMNTLHWHLTDAQSFPIQSTVYPNLTAGPGGVCVCVKTAIPSLQPAILSLQPITTTCDTVGIPSRLPFLLLVVHLPSCLGLVPEVYSNDLLAC